MLADQGERLFRNPQGSQLGLGPNQAGSDDAPGCFPGSRGVRADLTVDVNDQAVGAGRADSAIPARMCSQAERT